MYYRTSAKWALIVPLLVMTSFGSAGLLNPDEDCSVDVCLPPIDVYGSPVGGSGGGMLGGSGGGGRPVYDTQPLSNDPTSSEIAKLSIKEEGDVRCSLTSKELRNTTSRSDLITRQLAAQSVFRTLGLFSAGRKAALARGFLEVTYADGGTEGWFIPYPAFSDGGINEPVPNSLVDGGGTVKSSDNLACRAMG